MVFQQFGFEGPKKFFDHFLHLVFIFPAALNRYMTQFIVHASNKSTVKKSLEVCKGFKKIKMLLETYQKYKFKSKAFDLSSTRILETLIQDGQI